MAECVTKNDSLSIALVHTADRGGGAEASTVSLKNALKRLGHDVVLFVGTKLSDDDDVVQIERHRSFPGILRIAKLLEERLGHQYVYHPWFRNLPRLFSKPIDVIHFHSLWSGRLGYADVGGLPKLTRSYPSVMTLRDLWMLTGHCAYPAVGCDRWRTGCGQCPDLSLAPAIPVDGTAANWRRKRKSIQRSNLLVTTVSNWLTETARSSPIFESKSVETVYNGIDETCFYPKEKAGLRDAWGIPRNALVVMIAGQSVEGTSSSNAGAMTYAINALRLVKQELFVLAVGHSSQRFLSLLDRPGLAVPFQSSPQRLGELYNCSDVVLTASLWETFGRIPAEAQMCGIPVVAFNTGGIPEIVVHNQTGIIAPVGDSEQLAQGLEILLADSSLRSAMSTAATLRSGNMFSNLAIANRYVDVYRRAISIHQQSINR